MGGITRNRKAQIWAEMARRKALFHPNTDWDKVDLWGLFRWNDISALLKTGELLTDMKRENQTVWVRPSKECWETNIKPLVEQYTIDQLTDMAGWHREDWTRNYQLQHLKR